MNNTFTRRLAARALRRQAAEFAYHRPHPDHLGNADEIEFPSYIGNYTKALPHNSIGEVDRNAYQDLLKALNSGNVADFAAIPHGPAGFAGTLEPFTSPQAGLAFDLIGPDAHAVALPPAPSVKSKEAAAEMIELYWMAKLRDVSFIDYAADADVAAAAAELSDCNDDFKGPKSGGAVTPDTLFRGLTAGDVNGPYLSQFLLQPFSFGTHPIEQRYATRPSGDDHLTSFSDWLDVQNGLKTAPNTPNQATRFITTGRDLATYVHFDALYQAYLFACVYLLHVDAPYDAGNPYRGVRNQGGFATWGGPHILNLVAEISTRALKAVWHQKWYVHRRLRPEAYGGLVHLKFVGQGGDKQENYPVPDVVFDSSAVQDLVNANGTALLPMAFSEGSPTHPAYGAGHATVAGACTTILKAWFDESTCFGDQIPAAVRANQNGTALVPAGATTLTVGGELNKIAANISIGRNFGGVHWRSDYTESIKLGEELAIRFLQEQKPLFNEPAYLTLTKFDGTKIMI